MKVYVIVGHNQRLNNISARAVYTKKEYAENHLKNVNKMYFDDRASIIELEVDKDIEELSWEEQMQTESSVLYITKSNSHTLGFVVCNGEIYVDCIDAAAAEIDCTIIKNKILLFGAEITKSGLWQDVGKTKLEQDVNTTKSNDERKN